MFAMLTGIALAIPTMIFIFIFTVFLVCVVAFCAYKKNMSVLWWVIATVIMNIWVHIPFAVYLIKTSKLKCHNCGTSTKNNTGFCPVCGENVKKIDDKKFIQRTLLTIFIAIVAFSILDSICGLLINIYRN